MNDKFGALLYAISMRIPNAFALIISFKVIDSRATLELYVSMSSEFENIHKEIRIEIKNVLMQTNMVQYFNETNEIVNKKIKKALETNLKVIFCLGESLDEREKKLTRQIVETQLREGLSNINDLSNITIAYEPVWAIGTGMTATPEQAQEVHLFMRGLINELYGQKASDNIRILYGGSVKPDNAYELLKQPDIDGALVGGACLESESFAQIIESAEKLT